MNVKNITKKLPSANKTKSTSLVPNAFVSSGSLEDYIAFVNSIPLLSQEEEFELTQKWRTEQDVEVARYLVLTHLRLVVSIARTYIGYNLPLSDLIQEGTIGLMKAVKKFDERKGVRLVTFATYWIKAEINEYVIKNWRIVKAVTTKNHRKLFFNLRKLREDNTRQLTDSEASSIANVLNVSKEDVRDMDLKLSGNDVSLIPVEADENAPIHYLSNKNDTPEEILRGKHLDEVQTSGINNALDLLDSRSRDIIQSRWLNDKEHQLTLQDLANKYKVSAERIRQIEAQAMQIMKAYLEKFYDI